MVARTPRLPTATDGLMPGSPAVDAFLPDHRSGSLVPRRSGEYRQEKGHDCICHDRPTLLNSCLPEPFLLAPPLPKKRSFCSVLSRKVLTPLRPRVSLSFVLSLVRL